MAKLKFDRVENSEVEEWFYCGILTWEGNPIPSKRLKQRAERRLVVGIPIFILLYLSLLLATLYLAASESWYYLFISALLIWHQFQPMVWWVYPGLHALIGSF